MPKAARLQSPQLALPRIWAGLVRPWAGVVTLTLGWHGPVGGGCHRLLGEERKGSLLQSTGWASPDMPA